MQSSIPYVNQLQEALGELNPLYVCCVVGSAPVFDVLF